MKKTNDLSPLPTFSREYLHSAVTEFKNTRSLVTAALLCALCIIVEKFDIPIIYNVLTVSFTFIVVSLCSLLTGPVVAIPCGIITDLVGVIGTGYTCFFGYTLSAVAAAVIYALFLYRKKLSLERIFLSRFIVDVLVNVLLGSVWRVMMMNGPYLAYVAIAGIKNLLLLPFEVVVLVLFFNAVMPALSRLGFGVGKEKIKITAVSAVICAVILVVTAVLAVLYYTHASDVNSAIKQFFA